MACSFITPIFKILVRTLTHSALHGQPRGKNMAHYPPNDCAVFSLQVSIAVEICMILATPKVTNILEGSILSQNKRNNF